MLNFNLKGFLTPETVIKSNIKELENEFVNSFNSVTRKDLIERYKQYIADLRIVCGNTPITQWVNGSFVTQKANPADIDLVSFIDLDIAFSKKDELKSFIYPNSLDKYGVDACVIIVYPENHKLYHVTRSDRYYWMDLFGKTKPNRQHKRIAKGFLEINV